MIKSEREPSLSRIENGSALTAYRTIDSLKGGWRPAGADTDRYVVNTMSSMQLMISRESNSMRESHHKKKTCGNMQ